MPDRDNGKSYAYDVNGNIIELKGGSVTTKYYYDEIGQLCREDNYVTDQTVIYTYDASGNILNKKIYPKINAAADKDIRQ